MAGPPLDMAGPPLHFAGPPLNMAGPSLHLAGPSKKPIFAYNLNESTSGVGKLTDDRMMVAVSAMMGLSISNKTCLSPCSTTFVKSRSILSNNK